MNMAVNAKNWQELKKPNALEKKPGAGDNRRRAVFVAEPLERGFGMTLGNSLLRVLLSSLQGAAVTSIKIEGVLHEFSSLAGVREDVTDIVLNVKQIALRMEGEGPKRLHLSATGPAEVTAGMIATSGDIEVTNPDLVICHLDDGATLGVATGLLLFECVGLLQFLPVLCVDGHVSSLAARLGRPLSL